MEVGDLKNFWEKKGDASSKKKYPKPAPSPKPVNRNANNSNNKEVTETWESSPQRSGQSGDRNDTDEFGDIRPEVTPEGYGLRTPYGTHFNLDFLNYCQNIAENQTHRQESPRARKSSLGSQKSGLDNSHARSNSGSEDVHSSDAKMQAENNLWETRRRLDAFRSFRKRTPDRTRNLGNVPKMSPNNSLLKDENLALDGGTPPALANLLNAPIPQQNLQVVREQMAAALARLKYLETEVKQIQVLQVQISVLQREKQKLNAELKKYKENAHSKDKENFAPNGTAESPENSPLLGDTQALSCKSLPPPPPPQRKYKSVAVGGDNPVDDLHRKKLTLPVNLIRTEVERNEYNPTKDPSVVDERKDACIGVCVDSQTKQTNTDHNETLDAWTSSTDLITTMTKSCGDHLKMHNAETQCSAPDRKSVCIGVCNGNFSTDTGSQIQPVLCDKSIATRNDIIVKNVVDLREVAVGDGLVVDAVISKCDACTSMPRLEVKHRASNTDKVTLCEKSSICKPEMADFDCHVNIRKNVKSTATETEIVPTVDFGMVTDTILPKVKSRSTNTIPILMLEKASVVCPDMSDFSCNATLRNGVDVATSTESAELKESMTNTDDIPQKDFTVQFKPTSSDASVFAAILESLKDAAVSTDFTDEISRPPVNEMSVQTDSTILEIWYKNRLRQRCQCDASTNTNDLEQPDPLHMQSEIVTYVGKVESLLEEQQTLLADEYKELEGVLEGSENASNQCQIAKEGEKPPSLIEDLQILVPQKYTLPPEVKSACETVGKHHRNEYAIDPTTLKNSSETLTEEWFLLTVSLTPTPEYIKDFASQLRAISPYALTKTVNSLDQTGNSALHYAVSNENFALICTLTDIAELNVDQFNNAGYTASMLAAITRIETEFELQAVASLFQRANVGLHAKQAGQTALMLAVSHGCAYSAKLLLKAGADINAQDEDGSTALMCATEHGQVDMVKLLLAHPECDPTITDNDGSGTIKIAMDSGQRDIAILLYMHLKLDDPKGH